jgi:sulfoxide reductase heme-binding subunit YedZ
MEIRTDDSTSTNVALSDFPDVALLVADYFLRRIGRPPLFRAANIFPTMIHQYTAVGWNTQKRWYDTVIVAGIALYTGTFIALSSLLHPTATAETLIVRAAGSCAFLLLTIVLCIGPFCRLDPRFLPLLYNRRHLGVATFLVGLVHGAFSLFQFHAVGVKDPLVSIWTSNLNYNHLADFPFQPLGFLALIILFLMAATSHDFWLRNLTPPIWKTLHMLVYLAYALLVAHVTLGLLQTERSPMLAIAVAASFVTVLLLHLAAAFRERKIDVAMTRVTRENFVRACAVDGVRENCAEIISLRGERIAIFKHGGKISAVSNVCSHQNGPLGEGKIIDGCVTCPWHGYQYLPESGAAPPPFTEKVSTFRTKIIDGEVWLDPSPLPPGTFIEPTAIPAGPSQEGVAMNEFHVGYLPQSPPGIRRRVRFFVFGALTVAAAAAMLFASAQKHLADSTFEFGKVREFHGVLRNSTYPILVEARDATEKSSEEVHSYLLVAQGKHSADSLVQSFDGQSIDLKGMLIKRSEGQMIEVVPNTVNTDGPTDTSSQTGTKELGQRELIGEIVDTKCFLGVMNPGEGKVHRECAALCLTGGIPPAVFTRDLEGNGQILLLTDTQGSPLAKSAFLQRVGQPVHVQGNVFSSNGLLYIHTSAGQITPIP